MKYLAAVLATISMFAASAASANSREATAGYQALYTNQTAQTAYVKQKIRQYFPRRAAVMLAIANCESTGYVHWLPDGTLRPNSAGGSSAAGVFQVTLYLHRKDIKRMGLNMNNIDDYMRFVKYLADRNGGRLSDWNASRHCWGPRVASK